MKIATRITARRDGVSGGSQILRTCLVGLLAAQLSCAPMSFAETPKDVVLEDENGKPVMARMVRLKMRPINSRGKGW